MEWQDQLRKSKEYASQLSQLNNHCNNPLVAFSAGAFGQNSALKHSSLCYRCSCHYFFFIASSLFPGTEKREFDYVCITASFKSSIVLNCAKSRLRETLVPRQLRRVHEKEQRRAGHSQQHRHTHTCIYITIYFLFSKVNKVRDASQPNHPFHNSFFCSVRTRLHGAQESTPPPALQDHSACFEGGLAGWQPYFRERWFCWSMYSMTTLLLIHPQGKGETWYSTCEKSSWAGGTIAGSPQPVCGCWEPPLRGCKPTAGWWL